MTERAGWVLAGGRSSRMGRDKALIEYRGRPLAVIAAEAIAAVCATVSLVGDPERYAHLGWPVLPDNFPGQGPLSGIEAALAATNAEWNLVVACDMPALDSAVLEGLFALGAECAVPQSAGGQAEPLCAVYRKSCHADILEAMSRGVRKVTDAIPRAKIRYLQVADTRPFANLNTPEELRKYTDG